MKTFFWLWCAVVVLSGQRALAWDEVGVEINYACVGIDGIPITTGSTLAGQCCSGGSLVSNPPPACRAGFGSIISSAGGGVTQHLGQAIRELGQVAELAGTTANFDSPQNVVPVADAQAMVAGDGSALRGTTVSASGVASGMNPEEIGGGSSGSGGGPGFGGGAMSGGGLGTPGNTKRFKDKAEDEAVLEAGRYKSAGGKDGKNGKENSNPFDFFGRRDSGGVKGGGAGQGALRFGAQSGAGTSGNEAPRSEDDRDYLSRINPGDSIFKVVSKRYVKETVRNNVAGVEKLPSE